MKTTLTCALALIVVVVPSLSEAQTLPTAVTLRYVDDLPGDSAFSRNNAWRTWNDEAVSISSESGDNSLTLMFRTKIDGDYTLTNDLGIAETPFSLHGLSFAQAPKLLGAKPPVVKISGKPLRLVPSATGENPTLTLGARDPKRAFATFDLSAEVRFNASLNVRGEGNQNFVVNGRLSEEAPGLGLTKSGSSTLQLVSANHWTGTTLVKGGTLLIRSGESLGTGPLAIEASGVVQFEAPIAQAGLSTSLEIKEKGRLDVNGNGWVIDYTGESPLAAIQAMRDDGRIVSSTLPEGGALLCVEAWSANLQAYGQRQLDATSILIVAARAGDANLDGAVNGGDLARVKEFFNKPGTWVDGDFTQDGKVDFDDLLRISQSYDSKFAFDNDWNNLQNQ